MAEQNTPKSAVITTASLAGTPTKKRKNNGWKDARLRLMTLKTIATLDLWKDVKHGDKRTRDARALKAWEQNLGYAQVPFCKVTRWTTVDEHALKWIKESAAQDNKSFIFLIQNYKSFIFYMN